MRAYIDVRGPVPLYVNGIVAVELPGCGRGITVAEAEAILAADMDWLSEMAAAAELEAVVKLN